MNWFRVGVLLAILGRLASVTPAAIIESYKIETARFFVQSTIGLEIDSAISTTIDLPGNFWRSRLDIVQQVQAGIHLSDWLTIASKSQHLVPLDPGDPPKGELFTYFHQIQGRPGLNGTEIQMYFGIKKHGPQSGDGVFGLTIAKVNVREIEFYSNFQLGVHMGAGDTILTLIGELLSEGKSLLNGGTGVMIRRNGDKIYVGASKKGSQASHVQSTVIRQGTPLSPGPVIADFGGPEAWTDAPGAGILLAKEASFDPSFMPDLESGNAFFEVVTGPFPLEKFTSQLRQPDATESYNLNFADVQTGIPFGGDLASLAASDDNRFSVLLDENEPNGQVLGIANVIFSGTEQLAITVESRATRDDLVEFLDIKQTSSETWDTIGQRLLTLSDADMSCSVSNSDFLYSTPAAGTTMVRLRWIPTQDLLTSDGWSVEVDHIELQAVSL